MPLNMSKHRCFQMLSCHYIEGVPHCTGSGYQSGGEAIHYDVEEAKRSRHQKAALAFSHPDVSLNGIPLQSFYIYHQYVLYHIGHSP